MPLIPWTTDFALAYATTTATTIQQRIMGKISVYWIKNQLKFNCIILLKETRVHVEIFSEHTI